MSEPRARRRAGEGSVERLPSGRHRVRVPLATGQKFDPHQTFETEEQAEGVRAALVEQFAQEGRGATGSVTFIAWGELVLERRKLAGIADVKGERSLFTTHIATAHFAKWPILNIRRRDVKRWLDSMNGKSAARGHLNKSAPTRKLSRSRIKNGIQLLVSIFRDALEDEIIDANPAVGLKVGKPAHTREPWTYLTYDEQVSLLRATPEPEREIVALALTLGVRLEELWLLHLADVHLDAPVPFVTIRYGRRESKGKGFWDLFAPKGKKIRDVPLLAWGLPAMRAWVDRVTTIAVGRNMFKLVFPGRRGGYRSHKKGLPNFDAWVMAAGITRPVRWHDLRHTCASSLVAGWWGRAWSLLEVCAMLGHSSIRVTERYAHLAPSILQLAAQATGAVALPGVAHVVPTVLALPASSGTTTGPQDAGSTEKVG